MKLTEITLYKICLIFMLLLPRLDGTWRRHRGRQEPVTVLSYRICRLLNYLRRFWALTVPDTRRPVSNWTSKIMYRSAHAHIHWSVTTAAATDPEYYVVKS